MSRDAWEHRDNIQSRISKIEAHTENIYHHIKRMEKHLEKQNSSIFRHESIINKWKGVAITLSVVFTVVQVVIASMMH